MDILTPIQNDLILQNLPLITFITKKYYHPGQCNWDDMWGAAALGLVKAAQKYDGNRGFSFSTFAGLVMRNEIFLALRSERKHLNCVSLDAELIIDAGDKIPCYEMIADKNRLIEEAEDRLLLAEIWEDIRQEDILLDYFGIGRPPLKQKDIAEKYKVSQSYVSRLIKKIIVQIRTRNYADMSDEKG